MESDRDGDRDRGDWVINIYLNVCTGPRDPEPDCAPPATHQKWLLVTPVTQGSWVNYALLHY